ncbi:hypothetical protein Tco_0590742 [Tanacetum coccineum]
MRNKKDREEFVVKIKQVLDFKLHSVLVSRFQSLSCTLQSKCCQEKYLGNPNRRLSQFLAGELITWQCQNARPLCYFYLEAEYVVCCIAVGGQIILNGNAEFHEIVDFLTRSSIHHALTVLERSSLPEKKFNTVQAHRFNTHYSRSKQDRAESLSAKRSTSVEQEHADERVGIPSSKEIGRKSAKGEPSVHKDPLIDEIPKDIVDYMETEDALDVGRTRDVVDEEKENAEDIHKKVSTDRQIVSTNGSKVSTDKEKDSTDRIDEAQVLLNMSQAKAVSREKEKGVEFKDIEETERPRPTSTRSLLTLKPLPKIDPKDKGK